MARLERVEYEGAYYHVMNRGRGRQSIFPGEKLCFYDWLVNVESGKRMISGVSIQPMEHSMDLITRIKGKIDRDRIESDGDDFKLYFNERRDTEETIYTQSCWDNTFYTNRLGDIAISFEYPPELINVDGCIFERNIGSGQYYILVE